jgi:hypothetical protein
VEAGKDHVSDGLGETRVMIEFRMENGNEMENGK